MFTLFCCRNIHIQSSSLIANLTLCNGQPRLRSLRKYVRHENYNYHRKVSF